MNAVLFPLLAIAIIGVGLLVIWLFTRTPKERPNQAMEDFSRRLDALDPGDRPSAEVGGDGIDDGPRPRHRPRHGQHPRLRRGQGIVLNEPSVIALNSRTHDVLAMGQEAWQMIGRTPSYIVAVRPLRQGAITDFDITQRMIRLLLQRVGVNRFNRPRVVICVPSAITAVERRAVTEAARRAGAADAQLIEQPMAAAIGAGLPINEPVGNMVVDIGGGTSETALISLGGVVALEAVRVGFVRHRRGHPDLRPTRVRHRHRRAHGRGDQGRHRVGVAHRRREPGRGAGPRAHERTPQDRDPRSRPRSETPSASRSRPSSTRWSRASGRRRPSWPRI